MPYAQGSCVSTHSRPKAAGLNLFPVISRISGFNTQPPEGGWLSNDKLPIPTDGGSFNTQPPEGGWGRTVNAALSELQVSTHSRPKAAGHENHDNWKQFHVSTHSRPKAAGDELIQQEQPNGCFNTQPPEGGWTSPILTLTKRLKFQHTAARRRLGQKSHYLLKIPQVSTHSRPKAAGF